MAKIVFEVNNFAIAYIMQLRKIEDFGVSKATWNRLLKGICDGKDKLLLEEFQARLRREHEAAQKLRVIVEKDWRRYEKNVLAWLKELTRVDFKEPTVRVCVVPFGAGQTPFKDTSLIIVGKIRKGWGYPETVAHELAHVVFNQNFRLKSQVGHPYVQLIEEEIAVRLGTRSKYFDYEIPVFADWVHKAQEREKAWKHYLQCIEDFKDISGFIKQTEKQKSTT